MLLISNPILQTQLYTVIITPIFLFQNLGRFILFLCLKSIYTHTCAGSMCTMFTLYDNHYLWSYVIDFIDNALRMPFIPSLFLIIRHI